MLSESKKLDAQIASVQAQLKKMPEGKLICARNGPNYKWYLSNGKDKIYIPKKKRFLAEKLAAKKYLSLLLEDLLSHKEAATSYLHYCPSYPGQAEQLLLDVPEYQKLLSAYFKPQTQELENWRNAPFPSNPKHPEGLIHKTASGNIVRSKSEALIDTILYTNKIPFRYECELKLGNYIIYPDFTICHPVTGQLFYWEHFGLMDDQVYAQKVYSKLNLYTANGIIPSINLIETYETSTSPLNVDYVSQLINYYFL